MIGFALCGSFCSFESSLRVLSELAKEHKDILPIMSPNAYGTDTRFGKSQDFCKRIEDICGRSIIHTIKDAEPIGPKIKLDCLVICPCTGNTLAKIAHGICDTSVTMAAKAHIRNERPIVLALASNDALLGNAQSIGILLQRRHIFFVPFCQDDCLKKPRSLVCRFEKTAQTVKDALCGRQIQPILFTSDTAGKGS